MAGNHWIKNGKKSISGNYTSVKAGKHSDVPIKGESGSRDIWIEKWEMRASYAPC